MADATPHDLHVLLVEIRGDVKATRDMVEKHLADDNRVHTDHENRLRVNEKFRWGVTAVLMAMAAIGSWGLFA